MVLKREIKMPTGRTIRERKKLIRKFLHSAELETEKRQAWHKTGSAEFSQMKETSKDRIQGKGS